MRVKTRLQRLESSIASTVTCPGCKVRPVILHHSYVLRSGKEIIVPPFPSPRPPCTCRPARKPTDIEYIIVHSGEIESRETTEFAPGLARVPGRSGPNSGAGS
jgi:hypothetical protein